MLATVVAIFRREVGPTTSWISFDTRSCNCEMSFFNASMNDLMFSCISVGVKPSCPTAMRMTPSLSLYSLPPTIFLTVGPMFVTTVPVFVLGIRPLGPSTLPNPALFNFCSESTWQMHLSNSMLPSRTCLKISSSPTSVAPADRASCPALESAGAMTQMRRSVLTECGSRNRFRTTGPFFRVRRRTWSSYLEDEGFRPTSKARMYCIASTRANCSVFLRSYWRKVLRAFFFFAGCVFDVVAHRIVWYVGVANRQTSGRMVDSDDAASRVALKVAASERGAAMAALRGLMAVALDHQKLKMFEFIISQSVAEGLLGHVQRDTNATTRLLPYFFNRSKLFTSDNVSILKAVYLRAAWPIITRLVHGTVPTGSTNSRLSLLRILLLLNQVSQTTTTTLVISRSICSSLVQRSSFRHFPPMLLRDTGNHIHCAAIRA